MDHAWSIVTEETSRYWEPEGGTLVMERKTAIQQFCGHCHAERWDRAVDPDRYPDHRHVWVDTPDHARLYSRSGELQWQSPIFHTWRCAECGSTSTEIVPWGKTCDGA